jgi:secreted trypsin-like serine protease
VLRRRSALTGLLATVTLVFAALFAGAVPAYAVADGTPAQPGQYPYAVKLVFADIPRPDGSHYNSGCTGSLIAPQWIITAGHCFHDVNRNPVSGPVPYSSTAIIGRVDDADTDGHVLSVVEDYQSPSNDIAIAKLSSPVLDIVPLRLAHRTPRLGTVLRLVGWGALDDVDPAPATHLRSGQVTVAEVDAVTVGVRGYRPLPTTSACLYDSGAPYVLESPHSLPELVSVESDGPDCPHDQIETTSRVDVVASWIVSTIAHHH